VECLVRNEFAGQEDHVHALGAESLAAEKRLIGCPVFSCTSSGNDYAES
jgi:hypothetical protein